MTNPIPRLLALGAFGVLAGALHAQEACRPDASPLLLVGMYHMANPGHDAVNVEADDVLAPRRQAEIAALVERLSRFRPTRVMVEGRYGASPWPERYREWRRGDYRLGRNEVEQVGFRVAAAVGLDSVTPVDYAMWMNGWTPEEIAPAPSKTLPSAAAPSPAELERTARLRASTVSEYLAHINDPAYQHADHVGYLGNLRPAEGRGIYARSDLLANWYSRNIRIAANVHRETRPGRDRVLLLFGNGHATLLRRLLGESSWYCLVGVESYLEEG